MTHFARIGDCTDRCRTWNPPQDDPDGEFSYIDISSVDKDSKRIEGAVTLKCADAPSRARQLVAAGDILVSTVRPNLNGVAVVPPELEGATASTGYSVLRPRAGVADGSYLFHWVRSAAFVDKMVRLATGASYPAVSDKIVRDSEIPLPPLAEQRHIASILDKADALHAKRREAIAKLDQLLQSVFLDMFGDPVMNPKNWPIHRLEEVVKFTGGAQPPKAVFKDVAAPGYLRLVQIRDFRTDKYATYIPESLARRKFGKDDVMIGRYGPPVFQIFRGLEGSYNVALMKAEPKAGLEREFLFHLLRSNSIQSMVIANSERSAGQSGVNLDFLHSIEVGVPPTALQKKFASMSESLAEHARAYDLSQVVAERLFNSIQQRAFAGTL